MTGSLTAQVTYECVVTLEPFDATVTEPIETLFVPASCRSQSDGEELVIDVDTDTLESFDGNRIDVGELVAQTLSVALEPYPRRPDLPDADPEAGTTGRVRRPKRPFAGLATSDRARQIFRIEAAHPSLKRGLEFLPPRRRIDYTPGS